MAIGICAPVVLLDRGPAPLWESLKSLGWSEIPSDLSEIDANWVYRKIQQQNDLDLDEMLELASYEQLAGLAYDLQDHWLEARITQREFEDDQHN